MALPPPVRAKRPTPGELRTIELLRGDPPGCAEFRVPTPLEYAEIEARAALHLKALNKTPTLLERYALGDKAMTLDEVQSLNEIVFLTEAAIELWTGHNIMIGDDDEPDMTPAGIAAVLWDPFIRSAWHIHLSSASTLERSEGNVSGASPNGISAEAPNTAEPASEPAPPAPAASPAEPESSVPE